LLETRDLNGLDDVVDEDVRVYKPSGEIALGDRDAWKAAVANEPFADSKIDIEDMVCEGEKVVVRYRLECVQVRSAFGVAPSNRRISTSGTKIYCVRGGKIVEIAGHDDILGVLRQLGVVEIEGF
jgi:predicted ester cyclase